MMAIEFMHQRQEMGKVIRDVVCDGVLTPIRIVKTFSGWRVVYRKPCYSNLLDRLVPGEQVLTPDLPIMDAKNYVIGRILGGLDGLTPGLDPEPDVYFVLPTLERVHPEEVA